MILEMGVDDEEHLRHENRTSFVQLTCLRIVDTGQVSTAQDRWMSSVSSIGVWMGQIGQTISLLVG